MNSAWRKLWPECVAGRDFEGFGNEDSAVIDDIVSLGKNIGSEVNNEESSYKRRLWRKCLQRKTKEGRMFLLL